MKQSNRSKFIIDFFAGGLAGIVSKTIVAPFERVKPLIQRQRQNARFQVKYKGIIDCFVRCVKQEGLLSMWRGNGVNVIRYFPIQALNFSFKDLYGRLFKAKYMPYKILSGGFAGSTTTFFVHPLDFARTRIAVDLGKQKSERQFAGLWSCLSKTFKSDGIKGLYRGIVIATISIFVYRGLYFGLYDITKDLILKPDTMIIIRLALAQATVIMAQFILYPIDTVKRKLMMQNIQVNKEYNGALDCFSKLYTKKGIRGFWRGSYSNIRRGLGSAVCLVLFDEMKQYATQKFIH